jgi:outer membrane lipoprotein carrier protein
MRRRVLLAAWAALPAAAGVRAQAADAGAAERLRAFVRDVRSGQADFTQTVVSPDGARRRVSSGRFEFQRPGRFRFDYARPFVQTIVSDGQRVWLHDPELNQVTVRRLDQALGATPAALLAGGTLEPEFRLAAEASEGGLDWVRATPAASDGPFRSMRVGFRGREVARIEIADAFGQLSLLEFGRFAANATVPGERFVFVPPPGADVIEQ